MEDPRAQRDIEEIETMRLQDVLDLIHESLVKNHLDIRHSASIFNNVIYPSNAPAQGINPKLVYFEKKDVQARLDEYLHKLMSS